MQRHPQDLIRSHVAHPLCSVIFLTHHSATDPFVLLGYGGYSLRCEAHRQRDGTFVSSLQVRDGDPWHGITLFESIFEMPFGNPDAAINWAMLRGRQIVSRYLEEREREMGRRRA